MVRTDVDPGTGKWVKKLVMARPLPPRLERWATDAINHTKNSFDQSLFAFCAAVDLRIKAKTYPWPETAEGLSAMRKTKTWKDAPSELWDEICRQKPYAGPDADVRSAVVRQMAAIANHKHTVGLTVGCRFTNARNVAKNVRVNGDFKHSVPRWDPVKQEAILQSGSGVPTPDPDYSVTYHIVFDTPPPVGKADAGDALIAFYETAQNALEGFKALAVKMGAA